MVKYFLKSRLKEKKFFDFDEESWSKIKFEIFNMEMDEFYVKFMMREDVVDVIRNCFLVKFDRIEWFDIYVLELENVRFIFFFFVDNLL